MRRVKVALDANIPPRAVRMLNSGFGDQGYEFMWEPDFAAPDSDDEFWAAAFRRFGGQIAISGDKNIAKRPHQMLAFRENKLISFFMQHRWANEDLTYKAAHLIAWWPRIHALLKGCAEGELYWVPFHLREGTFTKVVIPDATLDKVKKASKG